MPQLRVDLASQRRDEVVPGEFGVTAIFTNEGSDASLLNRAQAEHPSLVLEIQDSKGETVLMRPPDAPREDQGGRGEPIEPGETVSIEYVGFLDRSQAPGRYQVRYAGRHEPLGGTQEDPLVSEWLDFEVIESDDEFDHAELLPARIVRVEPTRFARLIFLILRWWHAIICWLRRLFGRDGCEKVITRDVDEPRIEVMSDAPAGFEAWNGTYSWRARFRTVVDQVRCTVTVTIRVRLVGNITDAQRDAWESAIEADWGNRFKLCCFCCCCRNGYTIVANIDFVASGEHQVVHVGDSTTNMGNWGRDDTDAVSHEFGHMLGALDEYYTVDGTAWGLPYQVGAGIMNNPNELPLARHYSVAEQAVEVALGTSCSTRAASTNC
jgi:hypothetical protein